MASWFNPRAVTYNSSPSLVAQSGAIGDTLYKLYTDARANKQEQERQKGNVKLISPKIKGNLTKIDNSRNENTKIYKIKESLIII